MKCLLLTVACLLASLFLTAHVAGVDYTATLSMDASYSHDLSPFEEGSAEGDQLDRSSFDSLTSLTQQSHSQAISIFRVKSSQPVYLSYYTRAPPLFS